MKATSYAYLILTSQPLAVKHSGAARIARTCGVAEVTAALKAAVVVLVVARCGRFPADVA